MLTNIAMITLVLLCINISFCKHIQLLDSGYEENYNVLHETNVEEKDEVKTGLKNKKDHLELRERGGYEVLNKFVLRPDWKIKSSHTKSYSHEGLLPNEDSNFNDGAGLDIPKKIQIGSVDLKITQKQETCFRTIQNEIANLFYDDLDISKNIFPLCCKTEKKCKPATTKCISVMKTSPKCTQKSQELTLKPKTAAGNTFKPPTTEVHHSVSNNAVVNVVIHVKCDHPEAQQHLPPNCTVLKDLSHLNLEGSTYNFSVSVIDTKTTEVTKYSIFNTGGSLNKTKLDEEPCVKRYESVKPNGSPDDKLFGEQDPPKENSKDLKMKFPQPLLPHDITVQITKATHKPLTTNYPVFICQITPILCKSTSRPTKSGVLTRSVKPGLIIWKKINLPKFWKSVPITKKNGCSNINSKVGDQLCREKTVVEHTSEENVIDGVSCAPDLDVTEEPNNCKVSGNSNTDFEMPGIVTCESNLNNTETADSEIRDENNEFDLTFGPIPIQCDLGSTSPINGSSQTSNIEVDQTLCEPFFVDSKYLQGDTEPDQSSTEYYNSATEPYHPYLGSGQSLMEADKIRTEYVSSYLTFDQPYTELTDTPKTYDELKTELGQEFAHNVATPKNQKETTAQDGESGLPSKKYDNVMAIPNKQNIFMPGDSQTGFSGPVTESSLFLKTDLSLNTQDLLMNVIGTSAKGDVLLSTPDLGDKSTKLSPVNLVPHDILKSTPFTEDPMNLIFDTSSQKYISTSSINKIIESEESVKDISKSASEAAVDLLKLINESNNEPTKSNHINLTMIDYLNSVTLPGLDNSIFNMSLDREHIIPQTSFPETIMFATQSQSESTLSMPLLESYLSNPKENSYNINEGDVENIIALKNSSFLFYRNPKWFIANKNHVWNFDEGTIEIVNDTFRKMSVEHNIDNNEENKEIIRHMFRQTETYNGSEEVPFEMFVQAILLFSEYNHDISTFEWSGLSFNLKEMIAMLRVINIDSFTGNKWESFDWMTIYRLVKESAKTTSHDQNEYNITEVDGSSHPLIVFSNGSSIWNNTKLDRSEILNSIQNVNSIIYFFKQTMYVPYKSYDPSFVSFVKHIFEQRINSNVTYSEYVWDSSTYNWNELLVLLSLINNTLTDSNNLELSLREHWNDILFKFRNSKRHYYTDRTVYDISVDTQVKPMTIFRNGTTVFDGKRVTLDEVTHWVGDLTVSEVQTADVQHIINLGGRKFQFYWNRKWYITDQMRTWSFEDQTSTLMNESFFGLLEDSTVSQDSIQKLIAESSYNDNFEMPFELFAQSMLTTATYSEDILYQWSGYSLNYADILAMLRLSNFNNFDNQSVGYKWGQMNWYTIYDKLKQSLKSTSSDLQAYEILDYDGYIYPLIVFSNGTSIWKHSKLDLAESLATLKILNSDSYFPDVISVTSFISSADSFLNFMQEAIADRVHNKILHTFYIWKHYQFKWEDLEAMNRILLHYYESKLESELSFSKIALTVLNSTKQVFPNRTEFQIGVGSENKPLIVYLNGTTEYENVKLEFMDTVQQVDDLKKSSNMVFKDDWDSEVSTLRGVGTNSTEPVESSSTKGVFRGYDFNELNNNPYLNVCYPINIGGGKVLFYMKNDWFITDGENIWAFESPLTQYYINEMVKALNQTFTDDPHLDKRAIQNLVDNKQTLKGPEELVMPHELIIQQYLFFMKHLDQPVASKISQDLIYQRDKLHVTAVQLLMALRLSSYNNFTTKEVELPWEKGKKLNWDWFFLISKRSERMKTMDEWTDVLNTSYFDEFQFAPLVIVYSNFSSDWGSQRLELDTALSKVQNANEHNSFLPVVVNGELASSNESFEWLYKEALRNRFENKRTYSKYKWLTDSVSWFDILIILRFPDAKPDALHDNMFWKNAVKGIARSLTSKYSDRIEYKVSGIDPHKDLVVTIYMNESTVFNDKKMEIEEYRALL